MDRQLGNTALCVSSRGKNVQVLTSLFTPMDNSRTRGVYRLCRRVIDRCGTALNKVSLIDTVLPSTPARLHGLLVSVDQVHLSALFVH